MHPAALDPVDLEAECAMRRERRTGPGGQHRNKVETAVVLLHRPTGLRAEANERRSQAENRKAALFRLRVKLALEVRSRTAGEGLAESPSPRWQSRVRGGRLAINPGHDDFPALLAEALDALSAAGYDMAAAAAHLGVTASQLTKLLKHEPRALESVNQHRAAQGLRPLK